MDIKKLSNIDKVKLTIGTDLWHTETLNGKLYEVSMHDGPIGVRKPVDTRSFDQKEIFKSLAYPCSTALAQTFNVELAYEYGKALANDAIEKDVDIILGPAINIKRNPLNGRNFEYFSEDPFLSGCLAYNYIRGVEESGVLSCVKHYACNNNEFSRNFISSDLSERALREIYLKPFEIAFKAKPSSLMCSYNYINGVKASENKKLFDIARDEFGFDGLIMSDWGAVNDTITSINAGLDLEMPYSKEHLEKAISDINNNNFNLNALNRAASNVIKISEICKKNKEKQKISMSIEDKKALIKKINDESIVLIKNEGKTLPINKDSKVLVTGLETNIYLSGGGSSRVTPLGEFISLTDSLRNNGINASYYQTTEWRDNKQECITDLKGCCFEALKYDYVICGIGENHTLSNEGSDRNNITLSPVEVKLIKSLRKYAKKLIVIVYTGAILNLFEIEDYCDAILLSSFGGEYVNESIKDILLGNVNPSGRLTESYLANIEEYPAYNSYHDEISFVYEEDLNVGYRGLINNNFIDSIYPFGYGLSYSEFEYSDFSVYLDKDKVIVEVTIKNNSKYDSKEVIQIYSSEITRTTYRPIRELKAFKKVFIKANEEKKVTICIDKLDLGFYSTGYSKWILNSGLYKIGCFKDALTPIIEKIIEIK